jgi:hypothetical protein
MLQRGPTGNPETDWMAQAELLGSNPPTPGTSRQMMHADVGVGSGLLRGDTLDRNPGFINPHDLNSGQGSNDVPWVSYSGNDQASVPILRIVCRKLHCLIIFTGTQPFNQNFDLVLFINDTNK